MMNKKGAILVNFAFLRKRLLVICHKSAVDFSGVFCGIM